MKWLLIIPIVAAALIVGLSIYLQPNDFIGCGEKPVVETSCSKVDAVIVVSGGDTQARTQAGIDLVKNGWADTLVLSGAALDKTGPSNAATMQRQAIDAGISELNILIDEEAANTSQNAENTVSILKERNYQDAILVTSGYHQRRTSLEFTKYAGGMEIRNYPVTVDHDWNWYWWLTPRGWWLAGGEVVKIIAFYVGANA